MSTVQQLQQLLTHHFAPAVLKIQDESANHVGHHTSTAGHFFVYMVSDQFQGRSLLERHRMVYQLLADLMPAKIHALQLQLSCLEEVSK